jgi:transcriptional regulator with XRE-family HTH domain
MYNTIHGNFPFAVSHLPDRIRTMSIGKRIEGARFAAGYQYASDLARAAGVTKQYLHNLENDLVFKPDPNKLAPICRALGVSMEWVVTGRGKPGRVSTDLAGPDDLAAAWSKLPKEQQAAMLEVIKRLASDKKKQSCTALVAPPRKVFHSKYKLSLDKSKPCDYSLNCTAFAG